MIYTATAATDSAGGYGFYDTITGIRWQPDKRQSVDIGLYQWGSRDAAGSVAITNISVTANTIADADDDGVADDDDAHPGYNDAELTAYLDTWLTENGYSNDGSGGGGDGSGGLSEQDIIDLRAGSTLIDASDGSAAITIQLEQSTDITDPSAWTDMGSEGQATVTVPMSGDTTFFRVRAQ